ncbi:FG-GAP repeat protein, partial [Streptomyces sp. NPDC055210]
MGRWRGFAVGVTVLAITGGVALGIMPSYATPDGEPAAALPGDVDGDGFGDLVVGSPEGAIAGFTKAGYVSVVYGSEQGVDTDRHKGVTQRTAGVPGTPEAGDRFGSAVAVGDVDGDGYADLATVAYVDDPADEGTLGVLAGSAQGLSTKLLGKTGLPFAGYSVAAGYVT